MNDRFIEMQKGKTPEADPGDGNRKKRLKADPEKLSKCLITIKTLLMDLFDVIHICGFQAEVMDTGESCKAGIISLWVSWTHSFLQEKHKSILAYSIRTVTRV